MFLVLVGRVSWLSEGDKYEGEFAVGVTSELDIEIGQRLRKARLSNGLTQQGLAEKIGISFQQVQKYENGSNRISSSRLLGVSGELGIPITYFFDELGGGDSSPDESELPDRVMRVARMLNDMPDGEVKDHIFLLIKSLRKAL